MSEKEKQRERASECNDGKRRGRNAGERSGEKWRRRRCGEGDGEAGSGGNGEEVESCVCDE